MDSNKKAAPRPSVAPSAPPDEEDRYPPAIYEFKCTCNRCLQRQKILAEATRAAAARSANQHTPQRTVSSTPTSSKPTTSTPDSHSVESTLASDLPSPSTSEPSPSTSEPSPSTSSREGLSLASSLWMAALDGDVLLVRELIAKGADPNVRDANGNTVLHLVAKAGYQAVGAALLAGGADPNARDGEGKTPLHGASTGGYFTLAQELIARGAIVDARSDVAPDFDETPIYTFGIDTENSVYSETRDDVVGKASMFTGPNAGNISATSHKWWMRKVNYRNQRRWKEEEKERERKRKEMDEKNQEDRKAKEEEKETEEKKQESERKAKEEKNQEKVKRKEN